jgi:hypothetical protein
MNNLTNKTQNELKELAIAIKKSIVYAPMLSLNSKIELEENLLIVLEHIEGEFVPNVADEVNIAE